MKNGVLFQYFEWNLPSDGQLWNQLARDAAHLADIGVTAVWIPPAYKGSGVEDVGYGVYDLYDFGEFDQKGTIRTKYGTREQLEKAIAALHEHGIQVILDTVLNHRMNGDETERFQAQPVAADNRMENIGEPREIESYTAFTFPGRGNTYSPFKWHWYHFSGVDYDNITGDCDIFRILGEGKGWSQGVDKENGNYDYLMGDDVDVNNPDVADELIRWGNWAIDTFGFDGFRMDAVKHIDNIFIHRFLDHIRQHSGKELYAVSEYWSEDTDTLKDYIATLAGTTDLFDVPLHFNFHQAGEIGSEYDMSRILDNSLTAIDPTHSVTFVDNHDSQLGSSLASDVQDWFKPMAYALILLMKEGYPVIFYGDYYSVTHTASDQAGNEENDTVRHASPHRKILDILLKARRSYAYGQQTLLFDHPSTIGLIRHGDDAHPGSGLVLLLSNGDDGNKEISLGKQYAGQKWTEITGSIKEEIVLDNNGAAIFSVKGRNIAVWIRESEDIGN